MRSAEAFAPDLFAKAEKARGEEAHGCPHPGGMRQRHTRLSAPRVHALKTHAAVRTLGVCAKGARSSAPLEACTEDAERAGFFAKLFLQKKRGKAGKGMNMERIDKVLALHGFGSRKEVAALVKRGGVTVNGSPVKKADVKIDPERDEVLVMGEPVTLRRTLVLMMNKPAGVLSASRDSRARTVVDLLPPELSRRGLFPAGRLDKDTEGLLILTDDGDLAHRMLSPKNHVYKLYEAELDKPVGEEDVRLFAQGLRAGELECLPAQLIPGEDPRVARVRIREGKFHQVKRMFHAVGKEVIRLRRLSIGNLSLDPSLKPGEARLLSEEEQAKIFEPEGEKGV